MTVHINPAQTFLGLPMTKARDVLHAWRYGKSDDAGQIASLKKISLPPHYVRSLLHEFEVRNLIGEESSQTGRPIHGLTDAGLAFAHAAATPRVPHATAAVRLEAFLKNVERACQNPDYPYDIERIWLFGSMVKLDKETIGDLDLVIEETRKKRFGNPAAAKRIAAKYGYTGDTWAARFAGPVAHLRHKILLNGRCPAHLSLVHISTLIDLAEPCRLIFDKARGGRVNDPVLPKHPKAGARSDNVLDPRCMPNLAPAPEMTLPALELAVPFNWNIDACRQVSPASDYENALVLGNLCAFPYDGERYQQFAARCPEATVLCDAFKGDKTSLLVCFPDALWTGPNRFRMTSPVAIPVDRHLYLDGGFLTYKMRVHEMIGGSNADRAGLAAYITPLLAFYAFADEFHLKLLIAEANPGIHLNISVEIIMRALEGEAISFYFRRLRAQRSS